MKKLLVTMFALAFVCVAPLAAMAGGHDDPGSAAGEAQAFQNLEITADQSAGVQNVDQYSITKTHQVDQVGIISGYGSLAGLENYGWNNGGLAGLVFGKLQVETIKTSSFDVTMAKVDAKIDTMSSGAMLAANAGASSVGDAVASAGNNANICQSQVHHYGTGGVGTQLVVASGFTNVQAGH